METITDVGKEKQGPILLKNLRESKGKACRKLHIQFGHARSSRFLNLLKDANVENKETSDLIKEVEEKCETCIKFKKPKLRPVVGFGLVKDFNDMVSMDHKFHKTTPWLHMIDHLTRFSATCVIPNKHETVIEKVFKHWIVIFGSPKKILSDNGCYQYRVIIMFIIYIKERKKTVVTNTT